MATPQAGLAPHRSAADSRLNALLDAAVDAMVLISERGIVTRFNPAAVRIFGYDESEVVGRNVSMLMPEPYHTAHDGYLDRYIGTGEQRIIGIGREVVAQRKDGSTFPIDLSVGEFRSDGERGFVGILRDISDRIRSVHETEDLRARLAHVARIGTLGEMVSGIAHEVNQPLTAITNYASACRRLLESGQARPAELAGTLEKISQQSERAGQVIRGLRNLVRRKEEAREPLDLNALVKEVSRLTDFELRQSSFRLVLTLAPRLPKVMVDGIQIQQVLINLIRNGFEAMRENAVGDVIEVTSHAADGSVELRVSDSGGGMDPKVVEHLFEPFVTTKAMGIGLGLSICKSIVSAHGGTLIYSPGKSGGTTFVLTLPSLDWEV
ncbi:MAG: PAS domain S-box protein [Pseudomonadota bacterium]|nr:PAS domain S-box protein [Pseudomonadota bacterium]